MALVTQNAIRMVSSGGQALEREGLMRIDIGSLEARSAEGDGGSHLLMIVARRRR